MKYFRSCVVGFALITIVGCNSFTSSDFDEMDQQKLARLALHNKDIIVREQAVRRITDQKVLAQIASSSEGEVHEEDPRIIAIKRLTDQTVLAQLAIKDENWYIRRTAAEKLTDQFAMAQVAINAEDSYVRRTVAQKLTDQSVMAQVAIKTKDDDVRVFVTERLSDGVLAAIDVNQLETEDFKRAMIDRTVESLSGFIKHHPDGIRVERALAGVWQLLVAEFPDDKFNRSTSWEGMKHDLLTAIKASDSFIAAFGPKKVHANGSWSWTTQLRELAGQPVTLSREYSTIRKINGDLYQSDGANMIKVPIQAYGQGNYDWWCNGDFANGLVTLEFNGDKMKTTVTISTLLSGDSMTVLPSTVQPTKH